MAALTFAFDTVKTGGHFLCKYYQGSEEKAFENKLRRLFAKVHREKPDSSRNVRMVVQSGGVAKANYGTGVQGGLLCGIASEGDGDKRRSVWGVVSHLRYAHVHESIGTRQRHGLRRERYSTFSAVAADVVACGGKADQGQST